MVTRRSACYPSNETQSSNWGNPELREVWRSQAYVIHTNPNPDLPLLTRYLPYATATTTWSASPRARGLKVGPPRTGCPGRCDACCCSINVARGTQQLSRRIMEAWPIGPLSRTVHLWNCFCWSAREGNDGWRGEMAVSPPRGCLGIYAVAVVQDRDALRLSVRPICSQVKPPVSMELDLPLSLGSRFDG